MKRRLNWSIDPDTMRVLLVALLIIALVAYSVWHFGRSVEPTSVRRQGTRSAVEGVHGRLTRAIKA